MKRLLVIAVVAAVMGAAGGAAATVGVLAYTHHDGTWYFTDVSSSPHREDIGWAYEYGTVNGYFDNTYRPGATVTREQMATYIMRNTTGDASMAWLIVDLTYHGGYYFGQAAYERGAITYDQWTEYENMVDWYSALVDDQASRARQAGRDPGIYATAARVLAAQRAKGEQ